jgi:hypothetical protein
MKLRYEFTGGNSLTNVKAKLILHGQYAQDLLEQSDEFKSGLVKLARTDEGGETPIVVEKKLTVIEDVTTPEQLIEFVGENLEKVYQRPDAALNYAKNKGFEFPNHELKKREEE